MKACLKNLPDLLIRVEFLSKMHDVQDIISGAADEMEQGFSDFWNLEEALDAFGMPSWV